MALVSIKNCSMNFVERDEIDKVHCRRISFLWCNCCKYRFCTVGDCVALRGGNWRLSLYGLLQLSGLLSYFIATLLPCWTCNRFFFHGFTLGCFVTLGKKMAFDGGFKKNDNKTERSTLQLPGGMRVTPLVCPLVTNNDRVQRHFGQVQEQCFSKVIYFSRNSNFVKLDSIPKS